MSWVEHWPIPARLPAASTESVAVAVVSALGHRGLVAPPVVIVGSDDRVEGIRIEVYDGHCEITFGLGELRGSIAVGTSPDAEGRGSGYVAFDSDDVWGPWEPLYFFFVDVARALGAEQEKVFVVEYDPASMAGEVCDAVDACVSDALAAEDLDAEEAVVESSAPAAFDSPLEVVVETRPDAVVVRARGAGETIVVTVPCSRARRLSSAGHARLVKALLDELEVVIGEHRVSRMIMTAPAADASRAGRFVLERRAGGALAGVTVLDDLREPVGEIAHALEDHDVEVIRYFSSGEPFFKVTLAKGDVLAVEKLDELHEERIWQWSF
jgi:hypothetical protein